MAALGVIGLGLLTPAARAGTIGFGTGQITTTPTNIGQYAFVPKSTTQVIGQENGQGPDLVKASFDQNVSIQGGGQAFLQAVSTRFAKITFDPAGSISGFLGIDFNPENHKGDKGTATFTLTATDQDGKTFTSGAFTLGNGNNRVFAQASGTGEEIVQLVMNVAGADKSAYVYDVKQVRITPAGEHPLSTPEPSTWLMGTLGLGLLAAVRARRRAAR